MKPYPKTLHVGLADFTPRALVILGDQQSLMWFAGQVASRKHIRLKDFPTNASVMNIADLEIVPTNDRSELRQHPDQKLVWTISSADAAKYAQQLKALAISMQPSHAYLDLAHGSDVEFIASKDEYDPAVLFAP